MYLRIQVRLVINAQYVIPFRIICIRYVIDSANTHMMNTRQRVYITCPVGIACKAVHTSSCNSTSIYPFVFTH